MTNNLSTDLTQVRIAYRLVVAYQRRLLDLIRAVEHAIRGRYPSLRFRSWEPTQWSRPGVGDPLPKWAWDFVPLHHFDVGWVSSGEPIPGSFWLWISHKADSGWCKDGRGEPDPFELAPPEACQTSLCPAVLGLSGGSPRGEQVLEWQKLYDEAARSLGQAAWSDGAIHEQQLGAATVRGGGFQLGIETLGRKDLVAKNITEPLLKLIEEATR